MLLLLLLLLMLLHAVQAEHSPDGQAHLTDHSLTCGQHQFSHAALVSVLGCSGAAAASCARIESILYTFVDFACYLWHAVEPCEGLHRLKTDRQNFGHLLTGGLGKAKI